MIEINKYRLTSTGIVANQGKLIPGANTYWGFIAGNITDQEDLVSWVEGHGYLTEHQPLKTVNGQSLVGTGNIQIEASVPSYYATKAWVQSQGYLVSDDLSQYATRQWVVGRGYATQSWVESQGYLTSHQDLSSYATMSWVSDQGYLTAETIPSDIATESYVQSALDGYATESWVQSQGYLTSHQDLSSYATMSWVQSQGYLTAVPAGYATESWVTSQSYLTSASTMMTDIESRLSSIEATLGQAVQITNDILS